jgi:hypothetical protein
MACQLHYRAATGKKRIHRRFKHAVPGHPSHWVGTISHVIVENNMRLSQAIDI